MFTCEELPLEALHPPPLLPFAVQVCSHDGFMLLHHDDDDNLYQHDHGHACITLARFPLIFSVIFFLCWLLSFNPFRHLFVVLPVLQMVFKQIQIDCSPCIFIAFTCF